MNIPYIDEVIVSIQIEEREVLWVEVSKRFNARKILSCGSKIHNYSESSLLMALEYIFEEIKSDIFKIAVTSFSLLEQAETFELPYFDSEDEVESWIIEKTKELENNQNLIVKHTLYKTDEDFIRATFTSINSNKKEFIEGLFKELDKSISFLYSGISEVAYSQLENRVFSEGLAFCVSRIEAEKTYVVSYFDGLVTNIFKMQLGSSDSIERVLKEVAALVKTEALNLNVESEHCSVMVPNLFRTKFEMNYSVENITLIHDERLDDKFLVVLGSSNVSLYEGLSFSLSIIGNDESILEIERKTFFRFTQMLVLPLLLLVLAFYGINSVASYQLNETTQIYNQINSKNIIIESKKDSLIDLYKSFKSTKELVAKRVNTSKVFQIIDNSIIPNLWLDHFTYEFSEESITALLVGKAQSEIKVTEFMKNIQDQKSVSEVILVSTNDIIDSNNISFRVVFKRNHD